MRPLLDWKTAQSSALQGESELPLMFLSALLILWAMAAASDSRQVPQYSSVPDLVSRLVQKSVLLYARVAAPGLEAGQSDCLTPTDGQLVLRGMTLKRLVWDWKSATPMARRLLMETQKKVVNHSEPATLLLSRSVSPLA